MIIVLLYSGLLHSSENMAGAHQREVMSKKTYKGVHAVWLSQHHVQNQVELLSDREAKKVLNLSWEGMTRKSLEEASRKRVMFHFLVWRWLGVFMP